MFLLLYTSVLKQMQKKKIQVEEQRNSTKNVELNAFYNISIEIVV